MKYYFLPALFFFFILSCNKDNNEPAAGTIEYRYNDSLQTIRSGFPMPAGYSGFQIVEGYKQPRQPTIDANYFFQGAGGSNGFITFNIITDSLTTRTYTYNAPTPEVMIAVRYNDIFSNVGTADDSCEMTITSYHNGLVSGTFEARLTDNIQMGTYPRPVVAKITQGRFRDIPVHY